MRRAVCIRPRHPETVFFQRTCGVNITIASLTCRASYPKRSNQQSDKNDGFPRLLTTPQRAKILPCPNLGSMSRPASANCFLKGRALCPLSAGRREKLPLRQNSRGTRKGTSTATTPGTTPNGNAGTAGLHLRPRNAERAETHARRAVERPKPSPTKPFSLVAGLTKPPWANGESG